MGAEKGNISQNKIALAPSPSFFCFLMTSIFPQNTLQIEEVIYCSNIYGPRFILYSMFLERSDTKRVWSARKGNMRNCRIEIAGPWKIG
jgi:hypothetical protein